jgi:hypothetical protein
MRATPTSSPWQPGETHVLTQEGGMDRLPASPRWNRGGSSRGLLEPACLTLRTPPAAPRGRASTSRTSAWPARSRRSGRSASSQPRARW